MPKTKIGAESINNKSVLITGGTGSFGKQFTKFILKNYRPSRLVIFSRDEFKQFHMAKEIPDSRLRFYLGDVRDANRLQRAFYKIDTVIHAAALKQVPALESNPFEAVQTNVLGSQNVINAAIDQNIKRALLISSDKAAQPINLYGATKLCAEKLFTSANEYGGERTKFSSVRYGNVIGSRGSIIETLLSKQDIKKVHITHPDMTRFWITLDQACDLVMFAIENMVGGEVIIPKIPSMKLVHLFDALAPRAEQEIIGLRPGEKLHEVLLTEQESLHSVELEKYYVILPEFLPKTQNRFHEIKKYFKAGRKVEHHTRYTSDTNKVLLTVADLKSLVKNNIKLG